MYLQQPALDAEHGRAALLRQPRVRAAGAAGDDGAVPAGGRRAGHPPPAGWLCLLLIQFCLLLMYTCTGAGDLAGPHAAIQGRRPQVRVDNKIQRSHNSDTFQ